MKQYILTVSAFALLAAPTFIFAEDAAPAEKPPGSAQPGGRRGSLGTPEERIKMMTEQLGLSQEQQEKIKAIFAKNADALKLIRAINVFVGISICVCCSLRIYSMFDPISPNSQ